MAVAFFSKHTECSLSGVRDLTEGLFQLRDSQLHTRLVLRTVSKNGIVKNSFKNTSRTPASVMGLVVADKIEEDRNALFYALQRVCELRMIVAYSV
ncbi:hypothetical protein RRG08_022643 [Elysia crispata]|uniref:Uncharacterized protein n=1 Tax=Elysia crispata TaxID=231223 RepID=A0AAE0Z1L9_9GAST|nr:hypothetical protein RRG08_022643 [Elysia crispata]